MTGGHAVINAISAKADEKRKKAEDAEKNGGYIYFDWVDRFNGDVLNETMDSYDRIYHNGDVKELMRQEGMTRSKARKAAKVYAEIKKEYASLSESIGAESRFARVATPQEQAEARATAIKSQAEANGENVSVVMTLSIQKLSLIHI